METKQKPNGFLITLKRVSPTPIDRKARRLAHGLVSSPLAVGKAPAVPAKVLHRFISFYYLAQYLREQSQTSVE